MANALAGEGVGPQDRVAFLDKNAVEHFEVLFGASKLNAVSVAVNWRLAPPEIVYIVNDADAKVLIVGQEFVPVLDQIADQLTTVTKILVVGGHATAQVLRGVARRSRPPPTPAWRQAPTTCACSSTPRARPGCRRA